MAESVIRMSAEHLAALRPLRDNVPAETIPCKICSGRTAAFDVVDFNKSCDQRLYPFGFSYIPVIYYRCDACSFIFTTFCDSWTSADYSRYIYNDDYVLVDPEYTGSRAMRTASTIAELLRGCESARILDYGSGSGVFAEAMKTHGFADIAGYDPFSEPERPTGLFEILTCFEVVEHAVSPLTVFEDMLSLLAPDGAIIIGVGLQPANIGEIRCNWWYIAPRNGHVSIYAQETFTRIADKLALILRMGNGLYAFSRPTVSSVIHAALDHIGSIFNGVIRFGAPADDEANGLRNLTAELGRNKFRLALRTLKRLVIKKPRGAASPMAAASIIASTITNPPADRLRFTAQVPCWNGREIAGSTPFRWTNSSEVLWPTHRFRPGTTQIRIPYLMEIVPGFAQGSRVFLGAKPLPTEVSYDCIAATVTLAQATAETVRLVTPPLRIPQEWGTPDPRTLGLAIPIV